MSAIPQKRDNPNGLHQRYVISKVDGESVDPMATYFVLRLDGMGRDGMHVSACRAAARAYATYVQSGETPHLAQIGKDLQTLVNNFDTMGG